jgi:ankyrin repeat protein
MGYGISCWTLSVTNTLRRLSETTAAQQAVVVPADVMNSAREDVHTMERSLSQAATVFDNDPDLQLRYVSTSMSSLSRLSIPSTSSRPQRASSDRSSSVASTTASTLAPADSESNWDDFHYYVVKCRGDKERIEQIRDILQRHSDGSTLAKSTDTWHRTPLHVAAQHGDVDLAQVLVTFGADVNAQDSELSSVLDMAIERKHRNFVAFLLDHGANDSAVLPSNIEVLGKMQRVIRFEKIATQ